MSRCMEMYVNRDMSRRGRRGSGTSALGKMRRAKQLLPG